MDVRDRARAHMLKVLPVITSDGATATLFTHLTDITHLMLLQSWGLAPRPKKKDPKNPDAPVEMEIRADPGPGLTSCNGFVGVYGRHAQIQDPGRFMGVFGLEGFLKSSKKSFAWIPSTAGARPKFGDIFEVDGRLHIGVSLDFVGDTWHTAEGGQGGKKQVPPRDLILRKAVAQTDEFVRTDKKEMLKGWVDVDLFVNGPPPTTVPDWLIGWWSIPWRGRIFFYFFEANFKASWTFQKPVSSAMVPLNFDDTATVTMDGATAITLKWSKTGSVEKFTRTGTGSEMLGMWNNVEPLVATKLF